MKISLNWLKKYVDINISTDDLVALIGSRLVEVEDVIDQTHKYDNIFVARVVECEKIPDTHLSLCQIDVGKAQVKPPRDKDGLIQVVCGAPNVRKGMLAVWIAPSATVPASANEDAPFIIGSRELRGHQSHGMLAGADELDFGTDHSAIAELDPQIAHPGQPFAEVFDLADTILDVENKPLTRRPDTFGIIGFAREVAGVLGQPFVTPEFLAATAAKDFVLKSSEKLSIKIADPKLCPRYSALIMERKDGAKSKYLTEMDTLISRSGMRPISPLVDATNYLMLLTGQPLHAFDYDKFVEVGKSTTPKVIVRAAKSGEKIELLDGREVQCTESDILVTSNNHPVALAGAMGGANTIIDENTRKIIVESATFSLFHLRKTGMAHGIFSEAITRFTKGQPADGTLPVLKQFAALTASQMKPLAIFDEYPSPPKPGVVKITTSDINNLLGTDYSYAQIETTLRNVGFDISCDCGKPDKCPCEQINVTPPYWRTDIHIKQDVIEEVGRLLGYDNITPTVPTHSTAAKNPLFTLKTQIRDKLAAAGANEILSYSFISANLITNVGQDPKNSYKIINSISPDLQYVRQQLIPSLLEKIHPNQKDGYDHFALFEMNQVYLRDEGLTDEKVPQTFNNLALVITGDFYAAKKHLQALGPDFTFEPIQPAQDEAYFEPKRSASIYLGDQSIGIVGEIKNSVKTALKLPATVSAFELSLEPLLALPPAQSTFRISQFPTVSRDITLVSSANYQSIYDKIVSVLAKQNLIFVVTPLSIYQKHQTSCNYTFHLEFAHPDKTLTSDEISGIMQQLEQIK